MEIFSFFEIWLINNPSLIDRFLLKTISLLGGKIVPETVFIFDETGLETKPPKFGMITQSCLNKSSFICSSMPVSYTHLTLPTTR